jgi:hypothetical protein
MSFTIAVIFDFDDTLAHDSTSGFIETLGLDVAAFWADRVQRRLDDGWDPIPAYLFELLEESGRRLADDRITRDRLRAWGKRIDFFPGVDEIFSTLRETARAVDDRIKVEYYLISSGIGEILRATSIASAFRDIWACDFHYDDHGGIVYPRNIVSFTEKTRFLFQISKGLVGPDARTQHGAVNQRVRDGFDVPFRQMIVVGDGQTDIPCFALVKRYGGVAIGVFDPDAPNKWGKAVGLATDNRVATICTADYRPTGGLRRILQMSITELATQIAHERIDTGA